MNFGGGEHQQTSHARMDSYLKGYEGGCPDITTTFPLPNGFHYVIAIAFKIPNGRGKLHDKQVRCHSQLKHKYKIETIVSDNYEEIIKTINDGYNEAFGRAKIPDKPKTCKLATTETQTDIEPANVIPQERKRKLKNVVKTTITIRTESSKLNLASKLFLEGF